MENTHKSVSDKLSGDAFISKNLIGSSIFNNKSIRAVLNKTNRSPCYSCKMLKANKNNPVCATCRKIAVFNARQ